MAWILLEEVNLDDADAAGVVLAPDLRGVLTRLERRKATCRTPTVGRDIVYLRGLVLTARLPHQAPALKKSISLGPA
jgi:hypothetical protein